MAVAAIFVCLAIVNIALVKTWAGEPEDGVLWRLEGTNVVAAEVAAGSAGDRAGLKARDVLVLLAGREVRGVNDVLSALHASRDGQSLVYVITREAAELPVSVTLQPMPVGARGLYYSLALVGILALVVGASVRLRRPHDPATLHFFWLSVAFFGVLSFTPAGRYNQLDYFYEWADLVARLLLPPLVLHFSLVFPERADPWIRNAVGRAFVPFIYLPAIILGAVRVWAFAGDLPGADLSRILNQVETVAYAYLAVCLLGGLAVMIRALGRLRSVTARRQLRWIVWGSTVGAVPFVVLYVMPLLWGTTLPYAEYTAVLLGCVPLAFASAIVRYRLMDVEVIIKKALVAAAVVLVLAGIYAGTLQLVGVVLGPDDEGSSFWALLATLIVALVAPWLWTSIQAALDRLYYRDRYDYRRALISFARELNSDLDLDRLSSKLVERVRETLGVDRIALFLAGDLGGQALRAVASGGFDNTNALAIKTQSVLGTRVMSGQTVVIDDPVSARRLSGEEGAEWRETGLYSFVPCVSNESTVGVIATGRRAHGEPLNSEDMTLLGAVAAQAATALENARLYKVLSEKATEIERLHQFSDSVVESLTDGLVVVDLNDRVLRWNRRMETLMTVERGQALGRRLDTLFSRPLIDVLQLAKREPSTISTFHRVSIGVGEGEKHRSLLVNIAVSPFQPGAGSHAGWIIVVEDVTDRANLEEQLRLSEKMAAIGLLAAGVAHEVNTPLTGISSFTQMLLERSGEQDPQRRLLEKIEQQTFRAAKIISSLLNLSRPSGGEMGPVDVNVAVSDVLNLVEHQLRTSKVQVGKNMIEGPAMVRGVEYKLQQVFLNLFLNARDAMPKGGWLSVSTAVEGHSVVVEVSDTGVGIPSEHLARIYDPFFTTKPEGHGTGLGLSVTYGIVQEHGGSLTCESDVNHGTRFRLVLPALAKESTVAEATR